MLGTWILQSGGGTIEEPHNPTTRVTDLRRGENVFWWVVTNGNCSDYFEVVIVNGDVVQANAGRPQTICFDATRLEANDPEGAIGSWSVISGTANFENRYEPRTRVTNLSPGDNVLRWTISYGSSGSSSSSFSDVVITNNRPAEAIAGNDVAFCNDEYQLRGNTPATVPENMGTPLWTIVSGGGDLADANDPNTMVTNLAKGVNQLVYAITKGECVLRDTLQIINGLPSVPEAGDDVAICTDSYLLNPNTPTHGTARWRPGSTGGARFEGNTVYDLAQGDNELIYEIYTEWCSLEDVVIVTNNKPSASYAGQNRDICTDTYQLSAEAPLYGDGTWLLVAGAGEIAPADMSNPNAVVTGLASGSNRFKWTVDNNGCTSSSEVEIRYNFIEADAGDEQVICEDFTELRGSNPMQGTGTWGIKGGSGTAVFEDPNDPLTRVTNLDRGENVLTWTVTNRNCSSEDEVSIFNNKPTVPNAGDDQALCEPNTVLQGNVDVVGQGRWTVRSGSATFSSATHADAQTDPSANISGLTFGPNILRWTIINEGCTLYDDVVMTYNRIDAHAGNDRTVCADEIILSAQSPLPGSGSWSVPGGQGAAVFESPTSPTTRVTNLGRGTNTLRWTVWHNGCQTHDDMVVVNQMPSTPYAGNDQIICSDFATLDATAPTLGSTGYWRVLTGSAEFENGDETVHNASVTNLAEGDNIFVWTTQKVDGCTLEDQVLIRNNEPSDPYAGADYEEVCSSTFTLKASTPDYGTGIWSFVQGGGNLSDPNNPEATITTLGRGTNLLRWTVSQGNCSKFSEITIVNNTPTTANAGPDIEDCKDVQTLDANVPVHFDNAYWERISGYGELDDLSDPKSPVRKLAFGPNEFQWVIEKGSCTSTDRVVIFNKIPDKAFAGSDQLDVCDTYTVLNANDPESGTGQWSVIKGKGAFDDAAQYNTIVREMGFGENVYRWEVAYGECSTVDEVAIVSHKTEAYAGEDQVVYEPEAVLNANNAGELNAHWLIVGTSTATFTDETFFNTAVYNLSEGINTFGWEINVNGCISYDQVSVDYRPVPDAGFITDVEEGCFPLRVQFTNYSVGGSVYQWSFGDGSTSGDRNPVHVYTQPGQYTVQLNAPGPDGMDGVFTKQILVHDHPVADFTVNPTVVYVPGEKARFYDLSTDAVSWYWDFGDGVVSTDRNPSHEYSDEGVYDVMLSVGNSYECKDTLIVENAVVAEPQGFVVFPNAFKPRPGNASGQVDPSAEYVVVFKPAYRDVDAFLLEIFNRWGQKIFETNDIDSGWDGMYEGQMAPQAVYIYKATGKYYNGREFRQSGSVLLVR
jgi:gliding motility-associated-like protein